MSDGPALLARPWVPVLIALGLGVVTLPFQVYLLDDWIFLARLQEGSLDLFRFASGEPTENLTAMADGTLPWFAEPTLKLHFARPLSALTHALDHALFGVGRLGPGLHSLAWYVALVAVVGAIARRVLPSGVAAATAVLFAIAGCHVQPVVWWSARNVLISATLGGLGVLAHLAWRQQGWRPGAVLAPLGLFCGLLAGEAGLGILAYVLAFEAIGRTDAWRRRGMAVLPTVTLGVTYVATYVLLGFGASGSGAYLDPLHDPAAFGIELPQRLGFSLGVLFGGLGAESWFMAPEARSGLAWLGVGLAAPIGVWLGSTLVHLPEERRRPVLWLLLGAGLALWPQLAGLLGSRTFVVPGIGVLAAIATLLHDASRDGGRLRGLRRVAGVGLLIGHGVFALSLWVWVPVALQARATEAERALDALAAMPRPNNELLVLVTSPSADVATYGTVQLRVRTGSAPRIAPLTVGPVSAHHEAITPTVRDVTLSTGTWLSPSFARLYRPPGSFPAGKGWQLMGVNARVVSDLDGSPTRVRFSIEGPAIWLVWDGTRWVELPSS